MKVIHTETRQSFAHFVTSTCAIIGGVLTVASLLDSMIFTGRKVIKGKNEYDSFGAATGKMVGFAAVKSTDPHRCRQSSPGWLDEDVFTKHCMHVSIATRGFHLPLPSCLSLALYRNVVSALCV